MKKMKLKLVCGLLLIAGLMLPQAAAGQKVTTAGAGKAASYKAKTTALEYLSGDDIIRKYGVISDSIWSFAELGMQEFRSAELLAQTLEAEGFIVERGVAGIPTCFVATWGSGKPVIGILGEYDALPMLSQKAGVPVQDPIVEGEIGRAHV